MDPRETAAPAKTPSAAYLDFQSDFLSMHPDAQPGALFGMKALKVGRVTFLGGFAGGLVVKLDQPDADRAAKVAGAGAFDPSGRGRPMKAWVVLPSTARGSWEEYAELAYASAGGSASLP